MAPKTAPKSVLSRPRTRKARTGAVSSKRALSAGGAPKPKATRVVRRCATLVTDSKLAKPAEIGDEPKNMAMEVLSRIAQNHKCPISQQLLVDPVMAEDGFIYERKAIMEWLARKKSSPSTNKPMGVTLLTAVAARQTVGELVEEGMVDAEARMNFFLERGRMRVSRTAGAGPGPDLEGARADFQRVLQLATAPWQRMAVEFQLKALAWMQEGAGLAAEVQKMRQKTDAAGSSSDGEDAQGQSAAQQHAAFAGVARETQAWMLELGDAARAVVAGPFQQQRSLTGWDTLPKGTRVRLVDDVEELKRLCQRPAPGAQESVSWNNDMAVWAGAICTMVRAGDGEHKNYILEREVASGDRAFSFPYDAVTLMADF